MPGKMNHILVTGNLVSKEMLEYLKGLAPNVHVVRGDFDEFGSFPETEVVQIGEFKIGLCHGHQVIPWGDDESLAILQRKLDVDILVTGHTHKNATKEYEGRWFINPGSITGAYTGTHNESVPSFILMAMQGKKVVNFVYELVTVDGKETAEVHKVGPRNPAGLGRTHPPSPLRAHPPTLG